MIEICEFDHLIACSDYLARFLLFKCAFSMEKVILKKSHTLRYVGLAAWGSGNSVGRISEVTLRRGRLVLG